MKEVDGRLSSKHVPFPSFLVIFSRVVLENEIDSVLECEEEVEERRMKEKRGVEEREIFDILTSDEVNIPLPISIRVDERMVEDEQYIDIPFRIIPPSDVLMHINDFSKFLSILKSNQLSVNVPPLILTP